MAEEEMNMMISSSNNPRNRYFRLRTLINPSMEALPEELTIDILSRLPVKTIIHCKLVCKKWRNLVSDASFVNLHLSRSPIGLIIHDRRRMNIVTRNYNINYNDPGILKWVEIEDKVDHHHLHHDPLMCLDLSSLAPILQNSQMRQVGSVNGLICLWEHGYEVDRSYIFNPVTREYIILPRKQYYRERTAVSIYGFVVSSMTGEYKVVRIFQKIPPNGYASSRPSVTEAEVYTLGTCQWRHVKCVPYWVNGSNMVYGPYRYHGPYLNDHCHWIVFSQDSPEKLCSFDLGKETFRLFPSPPPEAIQGNGYHDQSLGVLKGCLCLLDAYYSQFTIWVMKEYGVKKSWQKEMVIKQGFDLEMPLSDPINLIAGLKDGSILMVFEDTLCVFDPRRKIIEDTKMFDCQFSGWAYRPSFLKLRNFKSERVHMF